MEARQMSLMSSKIEPLYARKNENTLSLSIEPRLSQIFLTIFTIYHDFSHETGNDLTKANILLK